MDYRLSVVIITWNSQRDVTPCLDSVLLSIRHLAAEVIVVDNGSTDETCMTLQSYGSLYGVSDETHEILQPHGIRINFIQLEKNYGVAFARNAGMKMAKGEFIWILDVDTIVNRDAIDGMMDYLISHPECGLCACSLQSEKGNIQDSCRRLPYPEYKIRNLLSGMTGETAFLRRLHEKLKERNEAQFYHKKLSGSEPFEAEYVIGACQLFRRTALDEVGYLDKRIFYGPEDADFCLRISRKGYKIVCLPSYHIVHHYNRISNRKIFSRISYRHLKGLIYFYLKHKLLHSGTHHENNG
ncbi:MAG: glycosyltransferase family 2 protein [Tannerella sp.]|jgi:GT2 family glycosyltransferase|nr:glycosyltransferase family 2 protein [Tannerella sp.]